MVARTGMMPRCASLALVIIFTAIIAWPGSRSFGHPPEQHRLEQLAALQAKAKQPKKKRLPDFTYDKADQTVDAKVFDGRLSYDADVASTAVDGVGDMLWYAWLEFTPGKGDEVWIGAQLDGKWTHRQRVTEKPGNYARPTLTFTASGGPWVTYEAESDGQWDIYAAHHQGDKPAQRISPGRGADIRHRVCAAPDGGVWITWQSDQDGQFDILLCKLTADKVTEPIRISEGPHGDWHPSVACTVEGRVIVAWDGYNGDSYDVFLRALVDDKLGSITTVAAGPKFQGRAQLVADTSSRIWIVWEEGGENWGRPYRPRLQTTNMSDELGPLHRHRTLRLAVVDPQGTLREVKPPLPMPSIEAAEQRTGASPGIKRCGAFYERPRLAVDNAGRLWLAYRHFFTPWLGVTHRSHVEAGWGVYARCLSSEGWSKLFRFSVGQGDGMQSLELAPLTDGVAAIWTTGRTHRNKNRRPRGIVAASLKAEGEAPTKAQLGEAIKPASAASQGRLVGKVVTESDVKDDRHQLYFGDLHRHTDLSLCRVPIDGTIDDAYRYAIDAVPLDFLGITDHSRDIALGDALSQLWWRSRKEVYRHELAERFYPFYAYERSHGNTADHNVISLRGDMLRPHTYPVPQFWKEIDPATTITIPHQPVRRDTWNYQDDARRPLMEIFQGCRDKSIAADLHRGLAKGYQLGIIASSDHMSTSASFACVWAERPSREAIFAALKDRRTYGATSHIRLIVRAGAHWMGQRVAAKSLPPLSVQADGTAPIRAVNFIVDGRLAKSLSPNRRQIKIDQDLNLTGSHYAYVHLIQVDGNEAWSSPIWLDPPTP